MSAGGLTDLEPPGVFGARRLGIMYEEGTDADRRDENAAMIPFFAAGTIVVGMVLGTRLGPSLMVKGAAWVALMTSGAAVFFWRSEPFASLVETLGYYYAVLMFALFYVSCGILLGVWFRSLGPSQTSR